MSLTLVTFRDKTQAEDQLVQLERRLYTHLEKTNRSVLRDRLRLQEIRASLCNFSISDKSKCVVLWCVCVCVFSVSHVCTEKPAD